MSANVAVILEGTLKVWSQEGGHAAADILVNGDSVSDHIQDFVAAHFGNACADMTSDSPSAIPGKWRVTLERIDDE